MMKLAKINSESQPKSTPWLLSLGQLVTKPQPTSDELRRLKLAAYKKALRARHQKAATKK